MITEIRRIAVEEFHWTLRHYFDPITVPTRWLLRRWKAPRDNGNSSL